MSMTDKRETRCPLTAEQVLDRYFLEHRAALLDIAAFLDRVDRAGYDHPSSDEPGQESDYRLAAMQRALDVLLDGDGDRARRVQLVFSDPTTAPAESAETTAATNGAYHGGPGA